jgi:hypothetical protein
MTDDPTVFQRLVNKKDVPDMMADLKDLHGMIPEEDDPDDVQGYELALSFTAEDVPHILEELEELADDGD